MPSQSMRRTIGRVLYPFGVSLPLLAILGGVWMWRSQAQTLRNAASVRAVVESVGVKSTTWQRASAGTSYSPLVRYSYDVDGRHYVWTAVNARIQEAGPLEAALTRAHRYHVGDSITAFHDRSQPKVAFLEVERSAFPAIWIVIWSAVLAGGMRGRWRVTCSPCRRRSSPRHSRARRSSG